MIAKLILETIQGLLRILTSDDDAEAKRTRARVLLERARLHLDNLDAIQAEDWRILRDG